MKRSPTNYLRERLEAIADFQDPGSVHNNTMLLLALIAVDAVINISETLEDISASLDRERLGTLSDGP